MLKSCTITKLHALSDVDNVHEDCLGAGRTVRCINADDP